MGAYLGLFTVALVAATLLPAQSEAALAALIALGDTSVVALVLVATLGNLLGSMINWWLGRYLESFKHKKWFPFSPAQLARAQDFYARRGRVSLLLSWVPIIGDPLTLVAGVMREKLWVFVVLVGVAKFTRYLVVAQLTLSAMV